MKVHAINLQQIAPEVVGNYLTQAGEIKATERTYISKPTLLAPNANSSDWVEITPEQKEAYEAEARAIMEAEQAEHEAQMSNN
jgi:hypothetical protein